MERIIEGVPYELCGTYLMEIISLAYANPFLPAQGIVIEFHIEETGHTIHKKFVYGKMLDHLMAKMKLDISVENSASDFVGKFIWTSIAIDEDRGESFMFRFTEFFSKEDKPAIAGDPCLTKDGLPAGKFLRNSEATKVMIQ